MKMSHAPSELYLLCFSNLHGISNLTVNCQDLSRLNCYKGSGVGWVPAAHTHCQSWEMKERRMWICVLPVKIACLNFLRARPFSPHEPGRRSYQTSSLWASGLLKISNSSPHQHCPLLSFSFLQTFLADTFSKTLLDWQPTWLLAWLTRLRLVNACRLSLTWRDWICWVKK